MLTVLIGAGGCASDPTRGYSFGTTHDGDIRSVAVPIVQNSTYNKGVEFELTEAIHKRIQSSTPWRIVPATEGAAADARLRVTVVDAGLRQLSTRSETGFVQELAYELAVDFEFKDGRTGRVIAARRGLTAAESFVPARPAGEPIETGRLAAVDELAALIVAELRSDWLPPGAPGWPIRTLRADNESGPV